MAIKTEVYQGVPDGTAELDVMDWIVNNNHLFPDNFTYSFHFGCYKGQMEKSICFTFIGEDVQGIAAMDKYAKDFTQEAYLVNVIKCDNYLHFNPDWETDRRKADTEALNEGWANRLAGQI